MYPVIEKDRMLYLTPEGGTVFIGNLPLQQVNPTAASIIELCDGTHTVEEICHILAEKYDDDPARVMVIVQKFLEESRERRNITFCEEIGDLPVICGNRELWVPYYISAELTKMCDLRCIHCYADAGPPTVNELSTERWLAILDEFHQLGTWTVNLTGGDPFAHPDIFDILDFCEKRFQVVIPTSGYRIDKDTVDQLSTYKSIEHIQVSLDGPDADTHNRIRGKKDSFQKAVHAIQALSEAGKTVHVAMVVLPENEDKIEETIQLAKSLGARVFGAGRIYSVGRAKGIHFSPEKLIALDKKVSTLSKKYSDEQFYVRGRDPNVLQTVLNFPEEMSPDEILALGDMMAKLMGGNCGAGYRSMFVTAEGKVVPCGMMDVCIGNVSDNCVEEILKSPLVEAFREIPCPTKETCGECSNRFLCSGCHALALMYGKDPLCGWRKIYDEHIPHPG
jgi:radical SAM protein with 4Fe4S-binding SPASM domain